MRRSVIPLVVFIVLCIGSLLGVIAAGHKPLYGLDLQGGLSVVLKPTETVPNDVLDRSVDIMRQRIDALGVAEPEISREGTNILVQLPGIKDPERALSLIGSTAELRFRPVLREGLPPADATLESLGLSPTTASTASTTTAAAGSTVTTAATATTAPTATTGPTTSVSATTNAPATTVSTAPTTTLSLDDQRKQIETQYGIGLKTATREDNKAENTVVLESVDKKTGKTVARYELGPAALKGDGIEDAQAKAQDLTSTSGGGSWYIALVLKGGETGIDALNTVAAACYNRTEVCPTGKLGIELDGNVVFAGTVQTATFERDGISLSGSYTSKDAKDIALSLRTGALPITLEAQSTQTVSATLGRDALHAGVTAGIIGLAIVSTLMILYYRWFGVVAVSSLLLSAALLWAIIAWLGETRGLTLTLAGVTGLIVSIGVSLDSNIVYFEHIKEDVWNGRTPRSAVERSFKGAWSTIKKADFAALLGAAVLWFLTIGSVKGFALFLGLATIIDLAATYFYLAPLCKLLARRPQFNAHPGRYGVPEAVAAGA